MKTLSRLAGILLISFLVTTPRLVFSQDFVDGVDTAFEDHMLEHLSRITTIKSFIIMGKLDGVREPAKWLAEHKAVPGLPENYLPYVESMRRYAQEISVAPNLKSAAMSVSKMAKACSDCHRANEVHLAFGYDTEPDEWADTVAHMQRHQWGVDRMWEGLIGPSDASWNRGADMLVDVPLHPFEVMDESASEADKAHVDKIARRLHMLGSRGTYTKTPDERSEMFGEVLGLCADCHTMLGRGPGL